MYRLARAAASRTVVHTNRATTTKPLLQLPLLQWWLEEERCLRFHTVSRHSSSSSSSKTRTAAAALYQQQQQRAYKSSSLASSTAASASMLSEPDDDDDDDEEEEAPVEPTRAAATTMTRKQQQELLRLQRIRNVGILAHVDAGKTTVTERLLALAGVVRQVGRVDAGNTVTDYLPQERERGITIQSAAIQFDWGWHNVAMAHHHDSASGIELSVDANDRVHIQLIDTPGHVDFSVEVHRSVAVLDGAVLVVDAVAGVQAQTETVWRAMQEHNRTSSSNSIDGMGRALPSLVVVNKMDKEGCHFGHAIQSIRHKLPGANPIPIQLPLFRVERPPSKDYHNSLNLPHIVVGDVPFLGGVHDDCYDGHGRKRQQQHSSSSLGEFAGVIDLIHMRAIVYPETNPNSSKSVEECIPDVYPLLIGGGASMADDHFADIDDALIDPTCPLTLAALQARSGLVEQLAMVEEYDDGQDGGGLMEEYYLQDVMPSPRELLQSIRTATIQHKVLPVLAAAALRGKGMEPLLDSIADLLPSPLDRPAPALLNHSTTTTPNHHNHSSSDDNNNCLPAAASSSNDEMTALGHPLHEDLLAFAFKVCHLQGGRGGSGDGRVVFCRVYSGQLSERDVLHVMSPPTKGEEEIVVANSRNNNDHYHLPQDDNKMIRKERVGGLLELKGGLFTNKPHGVCRAGEVCALVGLKTVVTGDTLVLAKKNNGNSKAAKKQQRHNNKTASNNNHNNMVCLAGVASPKPVLQVRLETETQQDQARLSDCLKLLAIEDPSLQVVESDGGTLLSGLGELHVEVTLDRLQREFGLVVQKGNPRVAYRETLMQAMETAGGGLLQYDRTVGDTRLQAAVHLRLEPLSSSSLKCDDNDASMIDPEDATRLPVEPTVVVSPAVLEYLQFKPGTSHDECMAKCRVYKALVQGCQGALKRGPIGSYAMANVVCHVEEIDAEEGLAGLQALPGAIRAAAMHAVATTMSEHVSKSIRILEPSMSIEISVPHDMVGTVLSDLTGRRGTVADVISGNQHHPGSSRIIRAISQHQKTLVRGQVPLVEILGYANVLRSLTAGEGNFTAEYKGHSVCSSAEVPH